MPEIGRLLPTTNPSHGPTRHKSLSVAVIRRAEGCQLGRNESGGQLMNQLPQPEPQPADQGVPLTRAAADQGTAT